MEKPFNGLQEPIKSGAQALSLDIGIKNEYSEHFDLIGLAERCQGELSLEETLDGPPFRLWTADHFDHDRPRYSTYGVSPILMAKRSSENDQRAQMVDAIFFANSSDTFVDVFEDPENQEKKTAHWMFESGSLNFFILTASNPFIYHQKLNTLTGAPIFPALWTLGYHQCRWNYMTQEEVNEVSDKMTQYNFPCDSVWLDIEYADEKRYLQWDYESFQKPGEMLQKLTTDGRRLVTIVDPHIKTDPDFYVL